MLVCHCRAVNERRIREAIEHGARDEFDIAEHCGAGGDCGGCVPVITALLAEGGCAPGCPLPGALGGPAGAVVGAGKAPELWTAAPTRP